MLLLLQIVNYLLLVQSLSRAGWPVEIVEEAVSICDLNEEKVSKCVVIFNT